MKKHFLGIIPFATSKSNGDAVFEFFDDFEGNIPFQIVYLE